MHTDERHTRTTNWADPQTAGELSRDLSGLAALEAIAAGRIPQPPISATLGFAIVEAREGFAAFEGETGPHLLNPMGGVHGGFACTLLDSALGSAVMSTLDAESAYGTVQLNVHLVRPIAAHTGRVRAEARVVHRGRTIATASGELLDAAGRLLAHATTTCAIFPRPSSK
jgi:uncharacterized protein (TIGR00369 family)